MHAFSIFNTIKQQQKSVHEALLTFFLFFIIQTIVYLSNFFLSK